MFEINFVEEDLKEIIRGLKKENRELKAENLSLKMEKKQQNDLIKYLQDQVDFYETQEMLDEERREWEG